MKIDHITGSRRLFEGVNIEAVAQSYQDQWPADHIAGGPASRYVWRFEPAFPLSQIAGKEDTIKLFRWDQSAWAEEGQADRFNDMLDEPIRNPVVLVRPSLLAYIWDGNHRIAACLLTHRTTIPAYLGIPKQSKLAAANGQPG